MSDRACAAILLGDQKAALAMKQPPRQAITTAGSEYIKTYTTNLFTDNQESRIQQFIAHRIDKEKMNKLLSYVENMNTNADPNDVKGAEDREKITKEIEFMKKLQDIESREKTLALREKKVAKSEAELIMISELLDKRQRKCEEAEIKYNLKNTNSKSIDIKSVVNDVVATDKTDKDELSGNVSTTEVTEKNIDDDREFVVGNPKINILTALSKNKKIKKNRIDKAYDKVDPDAQLKKQEENAAEFMKRYSK